MYRLLIEDDEGRTTVVPLIRNQINIGREEGNTIRLTERNVSRRHARLMIKDGKILIEDLQSYNGVWINGTRIEGQQEVYPGDLMEIGDYHLSIQEEESEAESRPRPSLPPSSELNENTPPLGLPAIKEGEGSAPPSRLIILNTSLGGKEYLLDKPEVTIGRTEDNDITIDHASVSRHHVKIVQQGDVYQLIDLGSANGVLVNGEEHSVCVLRWGDIIELGQVRLRFASLDDPLESVPVEHVISKPAPAVDGRSSLPLIVGLVAVVVLLAGGAGYFLSSSSDSNGKNKAQNGQSIGLPPSTQDQLKTKKGQEKLFKLAEEAFAREEFEEAIRLLDKLLAVRPKWKKAKDLRKQAVFEKANLALSMQGDALKTEGDLQGAYKKYGEIPKTSRFYGRALSKLNEIKPQLIQELLEKATRAKNSQRYDEAIKAIDEVLLINKEHPGALMMKKSLQDLLDQNPSLHTSPRRATFPSNDNIPPMSRTKRHRRRRKVRRRRKRTLRDRCISDYKKRRYNKALKCFKRWYKTHPQDVDVLAYIGFCYKNLGNCKDPNDPHYTMGICLEMFKSLGAYLQKRPKGRWAQRVRQILPHKR